MTHLTFETQLRSETDADVIFALLRKGWVETTAPTFDPATQAAPTWENGEWVVRDLTPEELAAAARKVWPNSSLFLQSFTFPEMAGISLSTDPTIAALRLLLTAWAGEVWSDDPRIQMGMQALVASGIINQARADDILAK